MSVEETDNELSYEILNNNIDDLLSDEFIYNMKTEEVSEDVDQLFDEALSSSSSSSDSELSSDDDDDDNSLSDNEDKDEQPSKIQIKKKTPPKKQKGQINLKELRKKPKSVIREEEDDVLRTIVEKAINDKLDEKVTEYIHQLMKSEYMQKRAKAKAKLKSVKRDNESDKKLLEDTKLEIKKADGKKLKKKALQNQEKRKKIVSQLEKRIEKGVKQIEKLKETLSDIKNNPKDHIRQIRLKKEDRENIRNNLINGDGNFTIKRNKDTQIDEKIYDEDAIRPLIEVYTPQEMHEDIGNSDYTLEQVERYYRRLVSQSDKDIEIVNLTSEIDTEDFYMTFRSLYNKLDSYMKETGDDKVTRKIIFDNFFRDVNNLIVTYKDNRNFIALIYLADLNKMYDVLQHYIITIQDHIGDLTSKDNYQQYIDRLKLADENIIYNKAIDVMNRDSEFHTLFDEETNEYRVITDESGKNITLQLLLKNKVQEIKDTLEKQFDENDVNQKLTELKDNLKMTKNKLTERREQDLDQAIDVNYSNVIFNIYYSKPWAPNSKVIIEIDDSVDKESGLLKDIRPRVSKTLRNDDLYEIDEWNFSKLMARIDRPPIIEGDEITLYNSEGNPFKIGVAYYKGTERTQFSRVYPQIDQLIKISSLNTNVEVSKLLTQPKDDHIYDIVDKNISEWLVNDNLQQQLRNLKSYLDSIYKLESIVTNGDFLQQVARLLIIFDSRYFNNFSNLEILSDTPVSEFLELSCKNIFTNLLDIIRISEESEDKSDEIYQTQCELIDDFIKLQTIWNNNNSIEYSEIGNVLLSLADLIYRKLNPDAYRNQVFKNLRFEYGKRVIVKLPILPKLKLDYGFAPRGLYKPVNNESTPIELEDDDQDELEDDDQDIKIQNLFKDEELQASVEEVEDIEEVDDEPEQTVIRIKDNAFLKSFVSQIEAIENNQIVKEDDEEEDEVEDDVYKSSEEEDEGSSSEEEGGASDDESSSSEEEGASDDESSSSDEEGASDDESSSSDEEEEGDADVNNSQFQFHFQKDFLMKCIHCGKDAQMKSIRKIGDEYVIQAYCSTKCISENFKDDDE